MIRPEVQAKVEKITALAKDGMTIKDAAVKVGMHPTHFYQTRKKLGLTKKKRKRYTKQIQVTEIPHGPMPGKAFVFYGDAEQITQIVKGLS